MDFNLTGIGSHTLTNKNLVDLRTEEFAGVRLPIAILVLDLPSSIITDIKRGLTLNLVYISEGIEQDPILFDLIDFEQVPTPDKDVTKVTFKLVHDYYKLIKTCEQELFEDTALNVLANYGFKQKGITSENESQVYIRANLSEKAFYRQLIQQIYLGALDCPISSVNLNEKIVKSLKYTLEEETPYITLTKSPDGKGELFDIEKVTSDSTLTDFLYGVDNVDSILKAETNEVYYLSYDGSTIEDIESYSSQTNLVLNPTKNDNCNCHPDYFQALIRNRTAWVALNSEKAIVSLYKEEMRTDIPLLCCAEILEDDLPDNNKEYAGKWVVTGKYLGASKTNMATHLEISRIPKDFFRRVKDVS